MAPQKRANQADIAERLGVSVSTVSRALANEIGISDAVRRDVQRMARTLGYKSKHGTAAASGNKKAVALVPLGSATSGLSGFYFGIVEGMQAQAASVGMTLDVRLVNESSVTLELIKKQIAQADAGGVLLAGIDAWDELASWSAEAEVPVVLVNGSDPNMRVSSVSPANYYGAYMATQRLLDAGHRKILHYTHRYRPTIRQRQRGFEQAIARTPGAVGTIVNTDERHTRELLDDLLAGKHDVTAAFIWNDIAAVEMLEGIYGADSPLPRYFSIIGFDDLPLAGMATPRLSTTQVDREAIGRGAVRLLAEHMDGETAVQQLEIGVSMVEGETVWTLE
ncbi:LacI family DNA-binding transcriptional regulator [Devosia ginsengisoli]|uniref:LacI family transcriptional regulator n=1 Tax=Devosia ginsengisoli TaxID=400770 RepID=A0A5B8LT78_9HYPH|nr:LacI family DNA-binding transcriptional regulator [Devosia ginsengisoli]QDZ11266.1 LacI family transcriptional regulator [Devosia ginsengisoli]